MDHLISRLILFKNRLRKKLRAHIDKEKAYIKKLLFPLKLFPIKLLVYFFYYPIRISAAIIKWMVKLLVRSIIWPFRKWSNFFKTIFNLVLLIYLLFSVVVIIDYINRNYGHYSKFLCGLGINAKLRSSIVRVVGGYSEGSGFFITENEIVTNFHVIDGEPSPKIIFADGEFVTPVKILGDRNSDLAVLYTDEKRADLVLPLMNPTKLYREEPLISAGFALGTDLRGEPTILKGRFLTYRTTRAPVSYIQTDINLVPGMSGGPILEQCGEVVGVNTIGLAGLSLFISSDSVIRQKEFLSEQDIAKLEIDPTTPEGAVITFYTYLKARRMEEGFKLLSETYLQKTNFQEWTNRFTDILDVQVWGTRLEDERKDIVFVKFSTKNWVNEDVEEHYYEGTWETVLEDGIYKMNKSNIKEVENPTWDWFYTD